MLFLPRVTPSEADSWNIPWHSIRNNRRRSKEVSKSRRESKDEQKALATSVLWSDGKNTPDRLESLAIFRYELYDVKKRS